MAYNGSAQTNSKGYARPTGTAQSGGAGKQQAGYGSPRQQAAPGGGGARPPREVIAKTGLFKSADGIKSIAGVQLREDIVLPAGTYINLYDNSQDEKRTDKSPAYGLEFVAGKLKPQAAAGK